MNREDPVLRYRNLWLAIGWCLVAVVIYLSVARVSGPPSPPGADKVGHFIAYGALATWFMHIVRERRGRLFSCLALACLGVALEFVQATLPFRDFEVADMVANSAGVLLGWIAAPPRLPNILAIAESMFRR